MSAQAAGRSDEGVLAGRLGLDGVVRSSIEQSYARWDGQGSPAHGGDEIPLPARISHVAETVEVVHRTGGVEARWRWPPPAVAPTSTLRSSTRS